MKLESTAVILNFDPYHLQTEDTPTHNLGERVVLADQRKFSYAKVGAAAVSKGKLQTAPAPVTAYHNMAVTATASGANLITVTPGATAASASVFDEGYAMINAGPGAGQVYKIQAQPAITASVAFTLSLFDNIATALTTSSKVTMMHNDFNGVIEGTSSTVQPAGIPLLDLAIGDFGWVQTRGLAAALADETLTLGAQLTAGTSTAGAVEEYDDDTTPLTDSMVGWAVVAGVDTEYRPIMLEID